MALRELYGWWMHRLNGAALLCSLAACMLAGCGHTSTTVPLTLSVPILMYHHIAGGALWHGDARTERLTVSPQHFEEQLAYLRSAGYTTITLDDLEAALHVGAPLPDKPVILTFDDGYQDFYSSAYPLLQRYNAKATIFIITGRVGDAGYMSWDELRQLAAAPLISIGAHTRHHPQLAKLKPESSLKEIERSKTDLETQLHIVVRHLAYPSGSYNATTVKQARALGFVTAVTVHYGTSARAEKLLELQRVYVHGDAPLADFIAGIEGRRGG